MDGECWQPHARNTLEDCALRHDHAIILRERDLRCRPRRKSILVILILARQSLQRPTDVPRRHAPNNLVLVDIAGILVRLAGRDKGLPVAQIGFVPFMAYVTDQIRPGNTVGTTH